MLKSLLRVRFAALLAAFTGQSRKRGRQTKGKAVGYALLMLYCFCAFVFLFYSSFSQLAEAFFPAGLGWLFFAMFAIMAFALMFIGSVFTAKSQLFEAKDNELLLSMPVRPGLILLSRMAAMLAMNFVFELVVALPVFAAWLRFGSPDAAGIAAFVLIVLALPLFALAVSCLFAWLISLLTSRMRNTTVITMVLSVVFLLAYFVFCFRMNTYVTQLAANGQAIAGALGAALPLVWLGRAAAEGNLACLGLTLLWTILPFALAYALLARSFIRIVTTNRGQIRVRYEKKAMHASSQDAALYRRELARLTSSSGYMLNAGLGLVFELALAVLEDAGVPREYEDTPPWRLWEGLKEIGTTAPLPVKKHRECLQLIAHAGCCCLYVDREGYICLAPAPSGQSGVELGLRAILGSAPKVEKVASLLRVDCPATTYALGGEAKQLHKASYQVEGELALHLSWSQAGEVSATATGGSVAAAELYAAAGDITLMGNGPVELVVSGKALATSAQTATAPAPDADPSGAVEVLNNPLVTSPERAAAVAAWVRDYLLRRSTYSCATRGNPEFDPLDRVLLGTEFAARVPAQVLKNELEYSGGGLKGNLILKRGDTT